MKKTLRRVICLVLCTLIAVSVLSFSGVSGAGTATLDKKAVFIDGYPDGTFLPDKTMTRAEAIKVTAVAAGYTANFDVNSIKTNFTDLNESEWYAPYVKYLEKYDMLNFYGKTLSASSGITRGEFVKLIESFVPTKSGNKSFPDVPTSHPYYTAIIKAAKAGIVEGNPDGTFNPNGTLTRAQIVTILDRLVERNIVDSNAKKVTKFSDVKGHWAEGYIIAASCKSTYDGKIVWYNGNVYAANSPVDKTKLDYSATNAVLSGVDVNNAAAVEKSALAFRDKRVEEINNTPTPETIKPAEGRYAYYVSNSGNDANDGKTPETAWKTIDKVSNASLKKGDVVYFKRGDLFRGSLVAKYGVTYSAYGEGAKPKLYASYDATQDEDFWELVPADNKIGNPNGDKSKNKNIYVSKVAFEDGYEVGNIVFNEGEYTGTKKVKGINGTTLLFDLDFVYNERVKDGVVIESGDDKVYLYSTTDPDTRFNSVEICMYPPAICGNGTNVTIDNLDIRYSGVSAVDTGSSASGLTIQNCIMSYCGGCLQKGKTNGDVVRLGNGAGWHSSNITNQVIKNCHIYQVYDSGITYQWFASVTNINVKFKNIKYTDNVIEYCTWGIEYHNSQPEGYGIMENIEFSGNFFGYAGDGWGAQRPVRGYGTSFHALINGWGGTNESKNFLIYDNIFLQKNKEEFVLHMAIDNASDLPEITGNVFIGKKGGLFAVYGEGDLDRLNASIKFEDATDKTIGLDDNTFAILK